MVRGGGHVAEHGNRNLISDVFRLRVNKYSTEVASRSNSFGREECGERKGKQERKNIHSRTRLRMRGEDRKQEQKGRSRIFRVALRGLSIIIARNDASTVLRALPEC